MSETTSALEVIVSAPITFEWTYPALRIPASTLPNSPASEVIDPAATMSLARMYWLWTVVA